MNLLAAGQLGSEPCPGHWIGPFRGGGEDEGVVVASAAGQGDVHLLAILGAVDDGQSGVHGAALAEVQVSARSVRVHAVSVDRLAPRACRGPAGSGNTGS
jgi:hypothetical protein